MRRDATHAWIHGECHFDHLVECGLVSRCAQRARVFLAVYAFERGIGVQHATAPWAEHVPRQLEQTESRAVKKRANGTFLVKTVAGRKLQDIDAAEIAVRGFYGVALDGGRDSGVSRLPQDREQA